MYTIGEIIYPNIQNYHELRKIIQDAPELFVSRICISTVSIKIISLVWNVNIKSNINSIQILFFYKDEVYFSFCFVLLSSPNVCPHRLEVLQMLCYDAK